MQSHSKSARRRGVLVAAGVGSVLAITGCGGKSDISKANTSLNDQLKTKGLPVTIDCPKTVTDDKQFDCKVTNTKTAKSTTVKFRLSGKDHDTLNFADQATFTAAVAKVSK